jgi:cell division septation protein DedD
MFQERDGDKELLLGNKQLLGIFFVLAILFGVFFTAGYMVGHTTSGRTADTAVEAKSTTADSAPATGGETHAVSPDPVASNSSASGNDGQEKPSPAATTHSVAPSEAQSQRAGNAAAPHASSTRPTAEEAAAAESDAAASSHNTYLQVAALSHSEALTVAKVLSKKGFHAHVSPKAGTPFYRVLVGPVHDAGELNSTRAALKSKGFREVFVQHL